MPDLIANLAKTNQFTVRVLCTPARGGWTATAESSPSRSPLVFLISLSARKTASWASGFAIRFRQTIRSWHGLSRECLLRAVPATSSIHTMARISLLFIDGKDRLLTYRLGPGTALAKSVRRSNPANSKATTTSTTLWCFVFPAQF